MKLDNNNNKNKWLLKTKRMKRIMENKMFKFNRIILSIIKNLKTWFWIDLTKIEIDSCLRKLKKLRKNFQIQQMMLNMKPNIKEIYS